MLLCSRKEKLVQKLPATLARSDCCAPSPDASPKTMRGQPQHGPPVSQRPSPAGICLCDPYIGEETLSLADTEVIVATTTGCVSEQMVLVRCRPLPVKDFGSLA